MIDTTTASGRLMFGIFAALAEFERELIGERTRAGVAADICISKATAYRYVGLNYELRADAKRVLEMKG
jgi:DNA invertase Pin-like site-specific DNA recombinase